MGRSDPGSSLGHVLRDFDCSGSSDLIPLVMVLQKLWAPPQCFHELKLSNRMEREQRKQYPENPGNLMCSTAARGRFVGSA